MRELAPRVLGILVRRHGDFSAAEDAVQEALLAAALQWPAHGPPDHPQAWLLQVASRRMTDQIRSDAARRQRETEAALSAGYVVGLHQTKLEEDDTLALIQMCCHPSLTASSAIALTLRAAGGLTTAEIGAPSWCRSPPWRKASAAPSKPSRPPASPSARPHRTTPPCSTSST